MSSRGLSAPAPKKSQMELKKSQNRLFFNYFDSFSTPFTTFWTPWPRGPGNSFSDSFSFWVLLIDSSFSTCWFFGPSGGPGAGSARESIWGFFEASALKAQMSLVTRPVNLNPTPLLQSRCFKAIWEDKRQTTWDNGFLQNSAVSCGSLQQPLVSCGFLRKPAPHTCCIAMFSRKNKNLKKKKSVKKTANLPPFVPCRLSLLTPPKHLQGCF